MMDQHNVVFQNVWGGVPTADSEQVIRVWDQYGGPAGKEAQERLGQLVFLVKDAEGHVLGMSSARKTYVPHLRNHFFIIRLMVLPGCAVPNLSSQLLISTRDFVESIHGDDTKDPAVGLLMIVQNEAVKKLRNEAIWPASGMVYIGNDKEGHHMRVYYFHGARIVP